jgi:hypothetical protein
MKVGDLVKLVYSLYEGIGIITNTTHCIHRNRSTVWYRVHWPNGEVGYTYEADELEVISESR